MDTLKFNPITEVPTSDIVISETIIVSGLPGPTTVTAFDVNVGLADGASNTSTTTIAAATSDTVPYTITANGNEVGYEAYKALDGDESTTSWSWLGAAGDVNASAYLHIDLGRPRLINKYRLKGAGSPEISGPQNWTLYGSNNNSTWVELHVRANGSPLANTFTPYFTYATPIVGYQFLKLEITKHGTAGVTIHELQLIEDTAAILAAAGEGIIIGPYGIHNTSITPIAPSTSNTVPYNITGPEINALNPKWKVFDGNSGQDMWAAYPADPVLREPIDLTIDLITPRVINKYRVRGYPVLQPAYPVYEWSLFGSVDGITWIQVHTHRKESYYYHEWSPYFTFAAPEAGFRYFKISCLDYGIEGASFNEIELIEHTSFTAEDYSPQILIVNGLEAGANAVVNNGDTLAIRTTASSIPHTSVFTAIDFLNYKKTILAVQTDSVDQLGTDPALLYSLPFEFTYANVAPANQLLVIDNPLTQNNVGSAFSIVDNYSPGGGTFNNSQPYVFVADYFGNKIHRIDVVTNLVVQTINVTSPYVISSTPISAPTATEITHTVVACPDTNRVNIYTGETHVLMHSVVVGNKPVAVLGAPTTTVGDFSFYVACFDDDTVEFWTSVQGAVPTKTKTYTFAANSGPAFLTLTDTLVWVSLVKSSEVCSCVVASATVNTPIAMAAVPWSIVCSETHSYVALPSASKVAAIQINNSAVVNINVADEPSFLLLLDASLFVLAFSSGEINRYDITTPTTLTYSATWTGRRLGMSFTANSDNTKLYVANLYEDSPNRWITFDKDPDNFDLTDLTNQIADTEVISNTVVISGITDTAPMAIPDIFGLRIIKNDIGVGTETTIVNGDTIRIAVTTPLANGPISVPIMFDAYWEIWEVGIDGAVLSRTRVSGYLGGG